MRPAPVKAAPRRLPAAFPGARRALWRAAVTAVGMGALAAAVVVPAAPAAAQARLRCQATDNGEPAEAAARVLRGDEVVAEGPCGRAWRLPPGEYRLEARLEGALDRPLAARSVRLGGGGVETVELAFETAELVVEVTVGGEPAVARVALRRDGDRVGTVSAGVRTRLGVGRWTVEVRTVRGSATREVTLSRGEKRTVRVEVDPA